MLRLLILLSLAVLPIGHTAAQSSDATARSFNPKISLILQGSYFDASAHSEPLVRGVLLGPETELRPQGLSLAESELVLEANADDLFHGLATLALENEDGETVVALEEATVEALTLPAGLGLRFGRMFSEIGYQNRMHSHAWAFADRPLVYRALLANTLRDDGVQLRWVAPTNLFLEVGMEALRGQGYPAGGGLRDGVNSWTGFVHLGGDVGSGGAWRIGLSQLRADADGRATVSDDDVQSYIFTGSSRLTVLDVVYKWAPLGNPARQNLELAAEWMLRSESGALTYADDISTANSSYSGDQDGHYLQAVYQFVPRWRVGLRWDALAANNRLGDNSSGAFDVLADTGTANRASVMVDYSRSEYSRVRLQYNADRSRPAGERDHQWTLQYIVSLGAHAAHAF